MLLTLAGRTTCLCLSPRYGTLLTVVLSTFIFSVMLTIIAFVCCKKFWKSRENLNLELVDDQSLYANTNFLTLNATQLINAYSGNGPLPVQSTNAIQSASTPTSSMNALAQPALLSPSSTATNNLAANSINNSLPAIATSMNSIGPMASGQSGQPMGALYSTAASGNSAPYTMAQHQNAMSQSVNATTGQSSITMTGYSMHPQALQQALIFYEPPPPYNSSLDVHRTGYPAGDAATSAANQTTTMHQPTSCVPAVRSSNDQHSASNIDLNTINLISSQAASASYQPTANVESGPANPASELPSNTNIWSQRLLLALGNWPRRGDCIYPVVEQPRKKLCRTLSQ